MRSRLSFPKCDRVYLLQKCEAKRVNGRGYWETSESNLQMLRELYQEVEDRIEGIE